MNDTPEESIVQVLESCSRIDGNTNISTVLMTIDTNSSVVDEQDNIVIPNVNINIEIENENQINVLVHKENNIPANNEEDHTKQKRKRTKIPDAKTWEIDVTKEATMRGEMYVGYKRHNGKVTRYHNRAERKMGPICNWLLLEIGRRKQKINFSKFLEEHELGRKTCSCVVSCKSFAN